jgi:hypothetical protein
MRDETKKRFTRQELYDLVWKTPMSQLAKEFDISDVGLRKICHQHNIPTASNKWWAAKSFGKRGKRDPLPALNGQEGAVITLYIRNPNRQESLERQDTKARVEQVLKTTSKKQGGDAIHPIARAMIKELRAQKPASDERVYLDSSSSFKFGVPKWVLPRVEALVAKLVPAILGMGYEIKATDAGARVVAEGYAIPIYVRDIARQVQVKARWGGGMQMDLEPTGRLTVQLNDLGGGRASANLWPSKVITDTSSKKVEDKIDRIILAISEIPIANRERDERNRAWEAAIAERERRAEEVARRAQLERDRVDFLSGLLTVERQRHELAGLLAILPDAGDVSDPRYSAFLAWTKARIQSHNDRLTAPSILGRLTSGKLFEPGDE